jgi:hypothetical protein
MKKNLFLVQFLESGNASEEISAEEPGGKEKGRLQLVFETKIRWKSVQKQNNRFEAFDD